MMRQKILSLILGWALILNAANCGGVSGGTSGDAETETAVSETENTVAAVSSMFSGAGSGDAQNLASRFTINSTGANICDDANMANAPTGVFMSGRGGASTYPFGSATDPMTVSSTAHYCEDENNNANTGTGPDGQGLFATFVLLGEPEGSCDDGSSFTFTRGSGITRNTQEYYPEIYGRFEISGGDIVNCTLRMLESGTVDLAHSSCTDDQGVEVALDTTVSCTIDANIGEIADPDFYKGHYGLGESAERNLNYDCVTHNGTTMDEIDHIMSVDYDCSALTELGVNIEFLSIGAYATDTSANGDFSSWTLDYSGTSHEELRPQIQLLRAAGFQVALAFDLLYYEDPENPDDDVDFPAELINNAAFQEDLTDFILQEAQFAEETNVDLFVPLSESDRVLVNFTEDDDVYMAEIVPQVQEVYTGKLGYIWSYDLSVYDPQNLTGFDLIGFNRSPALHDHLNVSCSGTGADSNCFMDILEANLTEQDVVITEVNDVGGNAQAFISSLGIWGDPTNTPHNANILGEVDWMDDANNAEMYELAFELAEDFDLAGLVVWEGADGEFVFPDQTLTLEAITAGFAAW